MGNTLSAYDPIFYANEAQIALEKALGMAGRVYRGYDDEKTSREKGSVITVKVPGTFTAQDAPSAAQDVTASSITMSLDYHKEVKFALTDKELSYTSQQIIADHIVPASYALADKIDQILAGLVTGIPWYTDFTAPAAVADITAARKIMFDNKVNLKDESKLHCMVSGQIESELLNLSAFTQHQGAGDAGAAAQMSGYLGKKFGFNFFANQNAPALTSATVADLAGAINNGAGYAAGIKSIAVTGMTTAAQFRAGDMVLITGHTQQYVLTADVLLSGGAGTLSIYGSPNVQGGGLESAVVDTQVVTIVLNGGSGATKTNSIMFHEGFAALAMAKLPDFFDGNGVKVFAMPVDPKSRISVRARTWSDPNNSKFYVALDALFGVKVLDGNKAVRMRD
ncbi:MAG: P22 phage major capsid protein family protein [Acidobacteriota bacterium]|nr:P22 phage major capsid protein family protein [Acidobacteriota bacterium]